MLKDIKISTILLLVVVGFLIYCLMRPSKEGFANEQESNDKDTKKQNTQSVDRKDRVDQPTEESEDTQISQEMVNQILDDSENKMSAPRDVVPEASQNNMYEGNDDDIGVGASLDVAFEKPVPDHVKTDVVDLNRNNVTNYNAKDYLPKETNDEWFNTDFSQAKYKMNDDKLINTDKYVVGVNTVGQSLKNASYDIRGAINVPKYTVSPWNNSTIEPDYNIKPLC
jgi:hypothetical protein